MAERKNILLTGGCGYIGSHTALSLLNAGYNLTIVDNLVNSSLESTKRVKNLANIEANDGERIRFFNADIQDKSALEVVFQSSPIFYACIHFAGLKAVGESVRKPLLYYGKNVAGTLILLELMDKYHCRNIVFSSSATVYGAAVSPITEETPVGSGITNPYGKTKYMIEEIISDFIAAKNSFPVEGESSEKWSGILLRYFNPVGAHPSGLIGEDPRGIPNNLMPFVAQVAVGRREKLTVFGDNYDTPDGTGVRDYLHVSDLAEGHLAAIHYIERAAADASDTCVTDAYRTSGMDVFNLGTGNGASVLQMIAAMEKASGNKINYEVGPRRSGDIDTCYASTVKAEKYLQWTSKKTLDDMCTDLWNWQNLNPLGYSTNN